MNHSLTAYLAVHTYFLLPSFCATNDIHNSPFYNQGLHLLENGLRIHMYASWCFQAQNSVYPSSESIVQPSGYQDFDLMTEQKEQTSCQDGFQNCFYTDHVHSIFPSLKVNCDHRIQTFYSLQQIMFHWFQTQTTKRNFLLFAKSPSKLNRLTESISIAPQTLPNWSTCFTQQNISVISVQVH